jgi:hypothetical protein
MSPRHVGRHTSVASFLTFASNQSHLRGLGWQLWRIHDSRWRLFGDSIANDLIPL